MAISERKRLASTAIAISLVGIVTGLLLGGALLPQTTTPQQYDIETTVEETTLGHTHNGSTHTHTTTITITETTPHTTFHAPSIPSVAASSATAPSVTAPSAATTAAPTLTQSVSEVIIGGRTFFPATATVSVGSTVTWTNLDAEAAHTVTSDAGFFGSHDLLFNSTFSHTFTERGTYGYVCELHPEMFATVVVE